MMGNFELIGHILPAARLQEGTLMDGSQQLYQEMLKIKLTNPTHLQPLSGPLSLLLLLEE